MPGQSVRRALISLEEAGYLIEVNGGDVPAYLPVHDIGTIRLADLLTAIGKSGESRFLNTRQLPEIATVDGVLAELEESQCHILGERTLKDLVLAEDAEEGGAAESA
jgi:hypothetical protein